MSLIIIAFIVVILLLLLKLFYFNGPLARNKRDLSNLIVVLTGASNGIGKETAFQLLSQGAEVIFACRDEKKTLKIISDIPDEKQRKRAVFLNLDLSSFESVENFVKEFRNRYRRLDILINNAALAVYHRETKDKIDENFQVNYFSHVLLTLRLLDLINICNGRVINVTGKIFSISDITSQGFSKAYKGNNIESAYNYLLKNNGNFKGPTMLYSLSKLFNVIFTLYLKDLKDQNEKYRMIKSVVLHPGVFGSDLLREPIKKFPYSLFYYFHPILFFFQKTLFYGSQTTMYTVYLKYDELTDGAYYRDCEEDELIPFAKEENLRKELMQFTFGFLNLHGININQSDFL